MTVQYYTYLYRDPKDGTPIYVGMGQKKRAWAHFKESASKNQRLYNTLTKRLTEGYTISPIINFEGSLLEAQEMEKFWINFYGRADLKQGTLFNLTDGGEGNQNLSPEVRSKLGSHGREPWNKGLKLPPLTEEHKQKMSLALSGKKKPPRSEETKKRISAAKRGVSNANKDRPKSEDHKNKISQTLKGNVPWNKGIPMSEETKAKLSATNTGKVCGPCSEEKKAKLRATWAAKRNNDKNNKKEG